MVFPAEVDSLLLRRFLEQLIVWVAVSAMEGVDVGGGGRNFCLPKSHYGTNSVYYPTLRLWVVPVRAAKLAKQGEMYRLPFLRLKMYPLFWPRYVWPLSVKDGSEMRL